MKNPNKLELVDISKSFDDYGHFDVLKNININAKSGEFVCVVGPSGCGKTIFLYLIAGFLNNYNGKISVDGKEVTKPNTDRIMMFQDYVLFPWRNVYENVVFGLENKGLTKEEIRAQGMKYLELVGLEKFKDWSVHKLSGGMQQRTALARALIINPDILLMDEPFSALDSQHRRFLRAELVKIWQQTKKTVVFVTHSINEAVYLADKIYLLSARPAEIKKEYIINLPRPRDTRSQEFMKISKEIDLALAEEFVKVSEFKLR